jgi:hypothetical protein
VTAVPEPTLSPSEAAARLKLAPNVFRALAMSGLLGGGLNGRFRLRAIEEYECYGTQWSGEPPGKSLRPDIMELVGVPPGTVGDEQPPDTGTQLQVSSEPHPKSENDAAWLAQLYLRPNPHLLPTPTALSLIGPVLVRLPKARDVLGTRLPTRLYPDPEEHLAMIQVAGQGDPAEAAFKAAYDVASPVLDELALQFDVPLHVCQVVVVGIPSGVLTLFFGKPPKVAVLDPGYEISAGCPYPELCEAVALYRDAISSDNPFHRFLSLYKTYESCCAVRGAWRKRSKRKDVKLTEEVVPKSYAFQGYEDLTFDQVKQRLNKAFRIALAHGNVPGRTPATGEDFLAIAGELAIVRYMARVALLNVRATLAS